MNREAQIIRELTDTVSGSNEAVTEFGREMLEFSLILGETADTHPDFAALKRVRDTHSRTGTGVAINPWYASLSLVDQGRTVAFIRGCVRAVESLLEAAPERPIHLIEAGCGPFAALSVPLMTRFGPDQLQVTLVDLHRESIESAQHVISELGLSDRLKEVICGDLMEIEFGEPADLVVLETMTAALHSEPQVSLTRRLVRALPAARLIPEKIAIDLQLIDFPREGATIPPKRRDRKCLGRVFELDRPAALAMDENAGVLPAATLPIPREIEPGQGLFLTTAVTVFDGVTIADYDAEITWPVVLSADETCLGRDLRFHYQIDGSPGFRCELLPEA